MRKIEEVWDKVIEKKYEIEDLPVEQFINWMSDRKFFTGQKPTIAKSYFTMQIYVYRTAIFRFSYNPKKKNVWIEKPIRAEEDTIRYSVFEGKLGIWEERFFINGKKCFESYKLQEFIVQLNDLYNEFGEFIQGMTNSIKINKIEFENYKSFTKQKIELKDAINIIIGENGTGKTSILNGVAVSLGAFLLGFDEIGTVNLKSLKADDINWDGKNYHTPCEINSLINFENKQYDVTRTISAPRGSMKKQGGIEIGVLARILQDEIRSGNTKIILPMFAYYGLNVNKNRNYTMKSNKQTRFWGYMECMQPDREINRFEEWYIDKKFEEFNDTLEEEEKISIEVIEKVVIKVLQEIDEKYVDVQMGVKNKKVVLIKDDEYMPISFLSDGYQKIIGIVVDIAWRMIKLNPQLRESVIEETPGIVLIDEIDLHLHPKWQGKVVHILMNTFKGIQFVISTHSPNVVNTINRENIIMIQGNKISENTPYTYGRDINSILMDVMDTPARPLDIDDEIKTFYMALDDEEYDKCSEIVEKFSNIMGSLDTTVVKLKTALEFERE